MTTHDALLPATVLQRKAVAMFDSRPRSRSRRTWRASGANTSWLISRAGAVSLTSRSLTTILGGRQAAPWSARVSTAWLLHFAQARLARCCASMPRGLHATAATGTIC